MSDDNKTTELTDEEHRALWMPYTLSGDDPVARRLIRRGLLEKCCGDLFRTKRGSDAIGIRNV